jgi:O-succinylbenzoic acid--CoA ligase
MLSDHHATLTALVPAQIYDLVNANLTSPRALRAVIVGGGALQAPLFHKAAHLGWKLLPSYGLTEASSQVATAELYGGPQDGLPPLKILDHMEVSIDPSGYIKIKSPSLLTLYALNTPKGMQFIDPKKDGWFLTEDRGELSGKHLIVKGRAANFIKIGGENVDLLGLERILEEIKLSTKCTLDMVLLPVPDPRLGHVIHLAAACQQGESENIITLFQNRVLPFERIRQIHYVLKIPRSPALKVLHHELLHLISQT